jgi:phosphoribosylglycinamide formyltransferase 1
MNLAIFASGNGSNFSAIIKEIRKAKLKVNLVILVCDNPQAFVVKRAEKAKIRVVLVRREDFTNRFDFEAAIIQRLKYYKIDLIALAGFMRLLSPDFVKQYHKRIINIHPSLLPAFKGAHAIKDAFDKKVAFTGVTVHFVDEEVDHGPVILQEKIKIKGNDSLAALEKRIHSVEHKLYPQVLKAFVNGDIKLRPLLIR